MEWIMEDYSEPKDSEEKEFRWCVIHKPKTGIAKKPMVVIGLNPSGKSLVDKDGNPIFSKTALRLHTIAEKNNYDSIILINLTPVVDPSSASLKTREGLGVDNKARIEEVLGEIQLPGDTPILLCFGNSIKKIQMQPDMQGALQELLNMENFKSLTCYCLGQLTDKKYPRHPLFYKYWDLHKLAVSYSPEGFPKFETKGEPAYLVSKSVL